MARPLLWQPRSLLCQITCVTVVVQHATRLARLSVPLARLGGDSPALGGARACSG